MKKLLWVLPFVAVGVVLLADAMSVTDGTNTMVLDPCQSVVKVYTPISQITSTQLVAGTSSKKIYICSVLLVASDAENVSFVSGTGTICATSTGAVIGSTTAANGMNDAANGGFVLGDGSAAVAAADTNAENLCLFQSGVGRVSGVVATATR